MQPLWSKVANGFFVITGFLACPCHLPLTLPLLLALTAGTALGAFLANNVWLVFAVSGAYFVGAILFVARGLLRNDNTARSTSQMNFSSEQTKGTESGDALPFNPITSRCGVQDSCCAGEPQSLREVTHERA